MCKQYGGSIYEPPSTDICDALAAKAESLAKADGKVFEDLGWEETNKYLDAASEYVHPIEQGDRFDDHPEV